MIPKSRKQILQPHSQSFLVWSGHVFEDGRLFGKPILEYAVSTADAFVGDEHFNGSPISRMSAPFN